MFEPKQITIMSGKHIVWDSVGANANSYNAGDMARKFLPGNH